MLAYPQSPSKVAEAPSIKQNYGKKQAGNRICEFSEHVRSNEAESDQ
jgi:hypothetical protein